MNGCLRDLEVRNLALIEHAHVRLSDGLNVITGETGAGKTMLAKALDLLLGAKTPKNVVRPGADAAFIEGTFVIPQGWGSDLDEELAELVADSDGELVCARRISEQGRSRCLVGGRTVSLETLRTLTGRLVRFYGQHEQRTLMLDSAQADILDASGDAKGQTLFAAYAGRRRDALAAAALVRELTVQATADQRALDLARFELDEIAEIDPQAGEESLLMDELRALDAAADAGGACAAAAAALDGEDDCGAVSLVGTAAAAMQALPGDRAQDAARRLEAAAIELADISEEIAGLASSWPSDPARQLEVQHRVSELHRLSRKHNCPSDELTAVHERLAGTVADADAQPQQLADAQEAAAQTLQAARDAAGKLTAWRVRQAKKLVKAVGEVLAELAMGDAVFDVTLDDSAGLGPLGAERVIFTLQANPGLPAEPLAQVASGGEASRLLLALISQTSGMHGGLLVLDEPDAGLGGQTAHGVAARLRALAAGQQVLVISHLPQIAARADLHLALRKQSDKTSTHTTITTLEGEEQILDELCRLAGHDPADQTARAAMGKLRG